MAEKLSDYTLIARMAQPDELQGLPRKRLDVIIEELDIHSFVSVDVLPLPEDAEKGVLYILPDGTMHYVKDGEWETTNPVDLNLDKDSVNAIANKAVYEALAGRGKIVEELPEEGEPGIIYFILNEESEEQGNIYDEWMYLQQDDETFVWEKIKTTDSIDLKLYNTTGTNTDGAMTQKATTEMVFADPAIKNKVAIGARAVNATLDSRGSVVIGSGRVSGLGSIVIGGGNDTTARVTGSAGVAIGAGALSTGPNYSIAIGHDAQASNSDAIAIGTGSRATRVGEINIGTTNGSQYKGYNSSNYRLLTGVYDGQSAHDAATVGQTIGTSETLTVSSWSALSGSDPYDYQATVSVTTTIPTNGTVELVNDQAALFATHGFAIGAVDTTNNTVTIYSIGEPTSSVSLNIKVRS